MLRKLRLKFVAICMALVTAVMAVVFVSVYVSMERNVESLSRQVLHRVMLVLYGIDILEQCTPV